MSRVCWSPSTRPRLGIISQTYRPAPCSAHSRRYAALVMPAMGASTTGVSTRSEPSTSARGRAEVIRPLCGGRHWPPKSALLAGLRLVARLGAGLGDGAGPGDRVELLARP